MEPLTIQIETDVTGVDQGIDAVDAALGKLEGQLESAGKAGQKSGTDAARGLRRIGTEAQKQEGGLAALERRLLDDLEPRERAEELERLASLRALVRYAR